MWRSKTGGPTFIEGEATDAPRSCRMRSVVGCALRTGSGVVGNAPDSANCPLQTSDFPILLSYVFEPVTLLYVTPHHVTPDLAGRPPARIHDPRTATP